jgi:NAD(P)-dependent dehydrogenase (short-subunit alcohol dehydrogenase family)
MPLPARDAALAGRHVVITGVGRSGQAGEIVAQAFAAAGAYVHLLDRDAGITQRAADIGPKATPYQVDLTDLDAVQQVAARVSAASDGRLAALLNIAGGFAMSGPLSESEPDVWHRMVAINLTTAYYATRAFLPLVRAGSGTVLFVGSQASLPGGKSAEMAAYAAAKAGVISLMHSVAQEELAHDVTANAVAPSAIRTEANLNSMGDRFKYVEREEFAAVLLHLCAPSARRITGQVIRLG